MGYVFVPKEVRKNKLLAKAEPALFLGLSRIEHGYRLLHLRTGKLVKARDVKFREDVTDECTYMNALLKGRQNYYPQIPFVPLPVEYVAKQEVREQTRATVFDAVDELSSGNRDTLLQRAAEQHEQNSNRAVSVGASVTADSNNCSEDEDTEISWPMPTIDQLRVGFGVQPPGVESGAQSCRSTKRQRGLRCSKRKRETNRRLRDYVMATEVSLDALTGNPASVEEALASPQGAKWKTAMKLESEVHTINGTPKHASNILTSTWVLRVKRDENVRGYKQKHGVDYLDTYSPAVRIETVRLSLFLAHLLGLECYHVDFVTAVLNGVLVGVQIFMEQPEHFHDGTDRVCELLKGLYGLKQAARLWYQTLHDNLVEIGFK
ncbi:polyprotein, partial [Phytophthora megakarya]